MINMKVFRQVIATVLFVVALFLANDVAYAYMDDYYSDEVQKWTAVIQIEPNNYDAYIERAFAYEMIEQYEKAAQDLKKAIQIAPNNYEAYEKLAELYCENKGFQKFDLAIQYYSKAIQVIDQNDDRLYGLYRDRALVYSANGQYEKSIADYSKCIKHEPDDNLYIQRGLAYMTLAKYNEAFKDFNSAVAYSERAKKEYFDFLERRGEPKRFPALAESRLAEAYLGRGACYFILGDRKKAVQDYTKSIQSYSSIQNDMFAQVFEYKDKLAQAYYGRGMAYQALGETAKAQADFAKVKQLASNG